MKILQEGLIAELRPRFAAAQATAPIVGQNLAAQNCISATVVAMRISEGPLLISLDHAGNPELLSEDLPFVSIGSGQALADPFLAFIRRVLWDKRTPNLAEGVLATLWSLKHAIDANAGGVSMPIQIATMKKNSGSWVAAELEDYDEHEQAIKESEDLLRAYFDAKWSGAAPEAPPTPKTL